MTTYISAETENSKFFQHSREKTIQNHWTMTKFKLELLIPKMYLYVKFELNVYNHWGDNERKLKISDFFSKFKRNNSVSYHQTMTKFEIDQCILMTYPYLYFELNMYNCWGDNKWELKISFFSKLKGHNSDK
jgi:hypothetical protein